MRIELTVHPRDGESRVVPLQGQLTLGRGPENDVVIPNLRVSWNHAVVWDDGEVVHVTDLNSRNGTVIDGQRVKDSAAFPVGSRLEIGDVAFTVQPATAPAPIARKALAVEHLGTGVRYPLRSSSVRIGDSRDADLRISGREHVSVVCHPDGEVWVGRGLDDEFVLEGEVFRVSGVDLRVVPTEARWTPAPEDDPASPVEVLVSAATHPPWARVRSTRTGRECTVTVANRVALLHALATAPDPDGWRSNTSVAVALWGTVGPLQDPRVLRSVVHHLRTELREAGLDPRCIEKRRGYLRLRVREAVVV